MKKSTSFLVSVLLVVAFFAAPVAGSPHFEALLEKGKNALDNGSFDGAREVFTMGLQQSSESYDRLWKARFNFYLGLTEQTEGLKVKGRESLARLKRAARYYEEVLESQSDSNATRKNLAQVQLAIASFHSSQTGLALEALQRSLALAPDDSTLHFQIAEAYQERGDGEKASAFYDKARELADTRQQVAYAEKLEEDGRWRRAAQFWEDVVKENPRSSEPHRKMMDLYLEHEAVELVPYLWKILEAGQSLRAVDGGLEGLLSGDWDKQTKVELLTVVAAGLARQIEEPREFPKSDYGQQLQKLEGDSEIGRGCRELRAVYVARDSDASSYGWWRRQGTDGYTEPPHGGMWSLDAFRELIRSLASWHRGQGDAATTATYYRLALDLDRETVDLEAFNGLVLLTVDSVGRGNTDAAKRRLEALDQEYAATLFTAKSEAYRQSEQERIFEFHRTLAGLYGALGEWGDANTPTSAIFQLEYARKTAGRLEHREPVETSRFTPEMANMLAVAYEQSGESSKSQKVRTDAAANYRRQGDEAAAIKVMQLDASSLPRTVVTPEMLDRTVLDPGTLERNRILENAGEREVDDGRTLQPYEKRVLELKEQKFEKLDEETIRKLERETLRGTEKIDG